MRYATKLILYDLVSNVYQTLKQTWDELISPGQLFEIKTEMIRGVPTRAYALAPPSLADVWVNSAGHGGKEYLIYGKERYTYSQAHEIVASVANWLQSNGVTPGERVAIAMRNYPEWMLAYWATVSIGAVVVGMNSWWVADEMKYGLNDSKPKILICDEERLQCFSQIRTEFEFVKLVSVRVSHDEYVEATPWLEILEFGGELPKVSIDPEDEACVFYTSGTTGRPKGAQLTHRGCTNNIFNIAFANAVQPAALSRLRGVESTSSDSPPPVCALIATPLFHVTANNCVAQATTLAGGKIIHMHKWDPAEALDLIEKERVTAFSAVPLMTRELLSHPDFKKRDTSSLATMGGGGAAMQPDLVHKVAEEADGAQPTTGYGMTETCGIISAVSSVFFRDKAASVGPAMPTFEIKCVNEKGESLPAGETGELWVRGAPVIKGYLNREDATAETITDGWLHTGDIVYLDEDGFIYLVDRAKDMVLRGGENVYCAEVENALFSHSEVIECIAFSVPDERLGEVVGAAIYMSEGSNSKASELREHCGNLLATYKIPQYIWFVDEPLPKNANGKFMKRAVKEKLDIENAA